MWTIRGGSSHKRPLLSFHISVIICKLVGIVSVIPPWYQVIVNLKSIIANGWNSCRNALLKYQKTIDHIKAIAARTYLDIVVVVVVIDHLSPSDAHLANNFVVKKKIQTIRSF